MLDPCIHRAPAVCQLLFLSSDHDFTPLNPRPVAFLLESTPLHLAVKAHADLGPAHLLTTPFPAFHSPALPALLVSFQVSCVHTPHSLCMNTCPFFLGGLLLTCLNSLFLGKGDWRRQNPPKIQRASTLMIFKGNKQTKKSQFIAYTHKHKKKTHYKDNCSCL